MIVIKFNVWTWSAAAFGQILNLSRVKFKLKQKCKLNYIFKFLLLIEYKVWIGMHFINEIKYINQLDSSFKYLFVDLTNVVPWT